MAGHKRSNTVILEPAKPVPSIPEPGLNITQQCQDLLTLDRKVGTCRRNCATMKDLMSLINQSGDLHDANQYLHPGRSGRQGQVMGAAGGGAPGRHGPEIPSGRADGATGARFVGKGVRPTWNVPCHGAKV